MNPLQQFYQNEIMRKNVQAFMIEMLGELAKELAFEGKDAKGIKEAKQSIDKVFDILEATYGEKKTPIVINSR